MLTGILDSLGRLVLPFIDRKEEDEEEEGGLVWDVGLTLCSVDGEGVLIRSSSATSSFPSSGSLYRSYKWSPEQLSRDRVIFWLRCSPLSSGVAVGVAEGVSQ